MNYYNEHDPLAAAWLRELEMACQIAPGRVDGRDIQDVTPEDVSAYDVCHFFAGVGGWELARQMAGWEGPLWTASLPCQPFSAAGSRRGREDERHIWPHFRGLVEQFRPPVIVGEQVSSKAALGASTYVTAKKSVESLLAGARRSLAEEPEWAWFPTIQADLEDLGYLVGASDLPAAGIGAPHIRQRLYWCAVWVADTRRLVRERGAGEQRSIGENKAERNEEGADSKRSGAVGGLADTRRGSARGRLQRPGEGPGESSGRTSNEPERSGSAGGLAYGSSSGLPQYTQEDQHKRTANGRPPERDDIVRCSGASRLPGSGGEGLAQQSAREKCETSERSGAAGWDDVVYIPCADGKARPIEPGIEPLVDGLPEGLVRGGDRSMAPDPDNSAEARVMRLRGYGNAIVPELAAVFLRSVLDTGAVRLQGDG